MDQISQNKPQKGLEIAEAYYREFGEPMIRDMFADIADKLAFGLVGSGSECFGFDDAISRDHDFEPGFCIFIPGEDALDRRSAFLLEREYSRLPKEFAGLKRTPLKPVGGARHGVIPTADFYTARVGRPDGDLSPREWLSLPDQALAEATNGRVFADNYGGFSAVRRKLERYPEDVRRKKLAGRLLMASQAGQYNYKRRLGHREPAAAQLAVCEFVRHAMQAVFLVNSVYMPYYKWSFRAMRDLPRLSGLAETFEYLITSGNSTDEADVKLTAVEDSCALIAAEIANDGIASADAELERLAYAVNDSISDAEVRNMHVLAGAE